jgi:hypothetical protein
MGADISAAASASVSTSPIVDVGIKHGTHEPISHDHVNHCARQARGRHVTAASFAAESGGDIALERNNYRGEVCILTRSRT